MPARKPARPGLGGPPLCVLLLAAIAGTHVAARAEPTMPASRPAIPAAARRAWAELFARDDSGAAKAQVQAVLAACGDDPNIVRAMISADTTYEAFSPGWHRRSVAVTDGAKAHNVEFALYVPRTYRPGRPHPVLVAAHGQHGNGSGVGRMMRRLLGRDAERYLIVAPTMPGPRVYNGKAYQEQAYLRPLQWTRRHLNVDDDRIALAGYSMGGHAAWHLAVLFPRHFAAAVPMAGVPWFEGFPCTATVYLENVANLPLWAIWGELDRPAPPALGNVHFCRAADDRLTALRSLHYRGTELRGVGHGGCFPNPRDFARFLAAGRRRAAPEQVVHFFHADRHRRGYYLEALELAARPMRMDRRVRLKFDRKPTEQEAQRRMADHFRKFLFRMWGRLDRSTNTLTIRTQRIRSVRVYVTEGMFDPRRPVTLRYGRRTWRGRVPRSARCMLLHYAQDRDTTAVVYNEIDFPSAGRCVVRHRGTGPLPEKPADDPIRSRV
jgi:pimeloyl-ACP methyl ester carboxylesterase